ncbi:MAG: CinA family nicotinamide mononucleotide deamidase-related protein [Muribaculaceae bacterium]|nr:CinA family nicotinamide mononucleotide deamidase-related protein [Muribaculaceae bacterium]
MDVSIIAIGDELLLGQVTDTNSGDMARAMAPYGWRVSNVGVIADNACDIKRAIEQAFSCTNIVLTTGGLGPTKDDITKTVLCEIFGGTLHEDKAVLENVKRIFSQKGLELNALTAAQAMVPTSCTVIQNPVGTAPVMWFERDHGHKVLVAMPGVPAETRKVFPEYVLPMLLKHFGSDVAIKHHTLTVSGISESKLAMHLDSWERAQPAFIHLAYLPDHGIIRLRIDGTHTDTHMLEQAMTAAVATLKQAVAEWLLYDGAHAPEEELLNVLKKGHLTVSTAESCTGGNIARLITSIPGSSEAMAGGVVAYSNEVKHRILGVSEHDLDTHGAVSIPVVKQMAEGARRELHTDYALATSGIAGPDGGSAEKPVGTVCIAIAGPAGTDARTWHFSGGRAQIVARASLTAIVTAIKMINTLNDE